MAKPSTSKVYFAKIMQKLMIMLNNRNMQINILEINRKSIIKMLNKLLHLSYSRHLKRRQVHVVIEFFTIKHGL